MVNRGKIFTEYIYVCWLSDLPSPVGIIAVVVGVAVEAIREEGRRNARLNNLKQSLKQVYQIVLSTFNSDQSFLNVSLPH